MAIATSIIRRDTLGSLEYRVVDITLDNSYPTGGWAVSAQAVGFGLNGQILGEIGGAIKDGYMLQYDQVNNKIKVFQGDNANAGAAPGVELANASAVMNGKVVRMAFIGLGHG